MVAQTVRRAEPPLRLTRRGRAVVLTALALIACAASVVLFTTASRASTEPATPAPTITVRPGDTLWDIAARVAPGTDPQGEVDRLMRRNHLTDAGQLRPGMQLQVP